jgi:predicted Zn-dependent peptidase
MLVDEFARLQTEPVSAEELAAAKRKLLGRYAVEHQPMRRQAFYLGWYESLGVGAQFDRDYPAAIELVTSNDIMEVAQRYFVNYALAVVVPAAE